MPHQEHLSNAQSLINKLKTAVRNIPRKTPSLIYQSLHNSCSLAKPHKHSLRDARRFSFLIVLLSLTSIYLIYDEWGRRLTVQNTIYFDELTHAIESYLSDDYFPNRYSVNINDISKSKFQLLHYIAGDTLYVTDIKNTISQAITPCRPSYYMVSAKNTDIRAMENGTVITLRPPLETTDSRRTSQSLSSEDDKESAPEPTTLDTDERSGKTAQSPGGEGQPQYASSWRVRSFSAGPYNERSAIVSSIMSNRSPSAEQPSPNTDLQYSEGDDGTYSDLLEVAGRVEDDTGTLPPVAVGVNEYYGTRAMEFSNTLSSSASNRKQLLLLKFEPTCIESGETNDRYVLIGNFFRVPSGSVEVGMLSNKHDSDIVFFSKADAKDEFLRTAQQELGKYYTQEKYRDAITDLLGIAEQVPIVYGIKLPSRIIALLLPSGLLVLSFLFYHRTRRIGDGMDEPWTIIHAEGAGEKFASLLWRVSLVFASPAVYLASSLYLAPQTTHEAGEKSVQRILLFSEFDVSSLTRVLLVGVENSYVFAMSALALMIVTLSIIVVKRVKNTNCTAQVMPQQVVRPIQNRSS